MVKEQVHIASTLNEHIQTFQNSPDYQICKPFVKVTKTKTKSETIRKEVHKVTRPCKRKLQEDLKQLHEEYGPEYIKSNTDLL